MPIKWSPLMVSEAMDMVEEFAGQAIEPLEQARLAAHEARKIPNLPRYVDQHLMHLIGEIERVTGGVSTWNEKPFSGSIQAAISSVRDTLPEGAVEVEKRCLSLGNTQSLM